MAWRLPHDLAHFCPQLRLLLSLTVFPLWLHWPPFPQPPKLIPSSEPLHFLFLLPGKLFPQIVTWSLLILHILPLFPSGVFSDSYLMLPHPGSTVLVTTWNYFIHLLVCCLLYYNMGNVGAGALSFFFTSLFHSPNMCLFLNKYLWNGWIKEWCVERAIIERM